MAVKGKNNTFVIQNNGASSYDCIFTIDDGSHQDESLNTKDISNDDLTYTESTNTKDMDSINTEVLTDSEGQNVNEDLTSLEESNFVIEDSQIVMDHSDDGEISNNDPIIYNATNADGELDSNFVTNDCGHSSPLWSYGEFLENFAKGDEYFKGFYYTNSYESNEGSQQENLPEENVVIEDSNIELDTNTSNSDEDKDFNYDEFIFENMNEDITSNVTYNTSSTVDNISNEEEIVSFSNINTEPEVIAPCDPNYKSPEHGDFYNDSYSETETNIGVSNSSLDFVEDDFKDYVGEKLSTSNTSSNDEILENTNTDENFETKFFNDYANQINDTTEDVEIFEDNFSSSADSRNYEEEFLAKFNYTSENSSNDSTSSFTEEEFFADTTFNSPNSNTTIIEDCGEDLFFKNCETDIENTKCDCCTPSPKPVKKIRRTCCNNNNHSNDFILFIVVLFLLWYSMSNNNNNCGSNNTNNCCCNFVPYYF